MNISKQVGSKYRFIILAGQRVAQLQKGALPRCEEAWDMKSTTIATAELNAGLLKFKKIADLKLEEELLGTALDAPPPTKPAEFPPAVLPYENEEDMGDAEAEDETEAEVKAALGLSDDAKTQKAPKTPTAFDIFSGGK